MRALVQSIIALLLLLAALAGAYWWFIHRPPAAQLETAVRAASDGQMAAAKAGATLDAERIVTRTIERERIIHEVTTHAVEAVHAAPMSETPLGPDFVRAVNSGLHDIDARAERGGGLPVF